MAFNVWQPQGAVIAADANYGYGQPSVLFETGSVVIGGSSPVFKMWYNAYKNGAGGVSPGLYYAESANGTTWSKYSSNPVIANAQFTRIFKYSGTYYAYVTVLGAGISVYTSPDGVTWTLQNSSALTAATQAWERGFFGQLQVCTVVNGMWYGYYTAQIVGSATDAYGMGLATSTDGIHWVKFAGNPVITAGGPSDCWFLTINGIYYAWSQIVLDAYGSLASAGIPSDIGRFSATNPAGPWQILNSKGSGNTCDVSTYYRTVAGEGMGLFSGQVADPSLVFDGTNTWIFYTATSSGLESNYSIYAAKAPNMTLGQLVETYEGIQNIPIHGSPNLNLAVLATDNFQRANANPIGSPWSRVATAFVESQIVSDVAEPAASTAGNWEYNDSVTWPNDQFSQVTLAEMTTTDSAGAMTRASESGINSAYIQYVIEGFGTAGAFNALKHVAGASTALTNSPSDYTMEQGSTILSCAIGTSLLVYWNGLLANIQTDSSLASGAPGMVMNTVATDVTANAAISAWSGGGFQNAPPAPGPSISGNSSWLSVALNNTLRGLRH
jgi:hypothetical protein